MDRSRYKKWVFTFLAVLAGFIVLNYATWKTYTEEMLFSEEYYVPELVRLGYISGSTHYRKPETTLRKKHLEITEYSGQPVDVMTIGDSFSNMHMNGRDPLYQDWLATLHDITVLNVRTLPRLDEFQTLIALLNSGYLDKTKPRAIILETVERDCIRKYARSIDFNLTKGISEIEEYYWSPEPLRTHPSVGFINTGNLNFIFNSIMYRFSNNAFFSQVYSMDLNASLFSVKSGKRLLFYHEDIKNLERANTKTSHLMNRNLNLLASRLKKRGITLYFMPAADKYNMYSNYIIDNPYPKSTFFELLRDLPKKYMFIDTKAILSEMIRNGEKDVYYSDDTHWSWKASKRIAESMRFEH